MKNTSRRTLYSRLFKRVVVVGFPLWMGSMFIAGLMSQHSNEDSLSLGADLLLGLVMYFIFTPMLFVLYLYMLRLFPENRFPSKKEHSE